MPFHLIPPRWRRRDEPDVDGAGDVLIAYRRPPGADEDRAYRWHATTGLPYGGTPARVIYELAATHVEGDGFTLTEYGYGLLLIAHALKERERDVVDA